MQRGEVREAPGPDEDSVRGFGSMSRDTSFISQKLGSEKKIARSSALPTGSPLSAGAAAQ